MSKRLGQNHKPLRARTEEPETQLARKKRDSVTATKGAEEDLEKSHLKYLALLESITDAFVSVDREWHFTYINEYGCKLMGKKKEELLGRVVWEVVPDFPENVYAGLHLSLTQNVPVHVETYNEKRKRWYEIHSYPSSEGLSIFFQDMRERKRAESVVQARLRMLVAANRVSMSVDEFLQVALDEIEAQTGSTIGFYHFLEADQETLSLQNWSTNTVRNMCTAEGKGSHYPISKAGVWVDCVHERRPVIHNDYASLPHRKGMPPGHAPITREMVVPIFRGDRIVAIIGVGNKPTDYDASDIEISSLLGDFSWEIVERKKAEGALLRAKQEWERTFKSIPDLIAIVDGRHRIVRVNPAMAERLGCTPDQCVGLPCYAAVHGSDAAPAFCPHTQTLADGREHTVEVREERLGGDFLVSTSPIHDEQGRMIGTVHVARDITEHKRMEEELRRSRDELELRVQERTAEIYRQAEMLDLAHDAIIVREMNGVITFWNEGATEMYGWGKEEARGKISCDLLETEFPMSQDEIMAKVVQEGRWEGELTQTQKDGKKINVLSRWALQKDEEGTPTGIMQISHDITQRLKLEEQLRQTQKLESIGTLAGGIAHDFNNILGAIVINSELALFDLPGGSAVRSNLDLILKSGLRGKDLVRQMLLFSRKSEKKQEIITLTPLIKETFKLLRSSLPTTIQMKLLLETESDEVSADPSQIQQVIMNLCTNAAYAMRGTTGSIDISLQGITFGSTDLPEADMQPGDYLVLSVKDTGSGMDQEVRKRIFEPFFTTKPVGEGTGLGLSVAYGIVKSHKGNLTVYSEPGRGSIFRVYIPKADTGASVKAETPKPIPKGNERILLLDDEEIIVKAVQNMLQHLGYKVTALLDNREALKLFSEKPSEFDLVITDQTMPFMTGEDLGKELMCIRPDIPVILCTGYSDLISAEKAKALGFQGFIMKPFTVREGAELVRSVLDQKGPQ